MLTPEQKFRKPLIKLKDVFDRARCHYEWWIALKYELPSVHPEKIPDEVSLFLHHSRYAHYKCMILDLYMILDTNPKAASLHTLLPRAVTLGLLDGAGEMESRNHIHTIKPIWSKIRELRHQLFAHTDTNVHYREVMQTVGLMADDFEKLIDGGLLALEPIWSKLFQDGHAILNFQRNSFVEHGKKFTHALLAPYIREPEDMG